MTEIAAVVAEPSIGTVEAQAIAWGERSDISARSVLVTILGDTVAPLGGSIWLADLINLAEPFGFNDRLVRTSMFRLASEGWVRSERVGRRSRYSLTEFGSAEIAQATSRIYRRSGLPWDGQWTLIVVDSSLDDVLDRHLRWHGFTQIGRDTYAMPNADLDGTRELLERLDAAPMPMVAVATFDESGPVADAEIFRSGSGLSQAEAAYRDFVEGYGWAASLSGEHLAPRDAFLLRTMVVHDLRRSRLNDPELPAAMLPTDWIGRQAMAMAAALYRAVNDAAWRWAEAVTGIAADPTDPQLVQRFSDSDSTTATVGTDRSIEDNP